LALADICVSREFYSEITNFNYTLTGGPAGTPVRARKTKVSGNHKQSVFPIRALLKATEIAFYTPV
jgi:hypothetical protein